MIALVGSSYPPPIGQKPGLEILEAKMARRRERQMLVIEQGQVSV